ncbi:MAG: cytochrome c oxidase subunit II [Pyrinomonadaceae bacterium]
MSYRLQITRYVTFLLSVAGVCLTSCGGNQSTVDSAGIQADRLEALWWTFFYVCAAVYVIVMAVLVTAIVKTRKVTQAAAADIKPDENRDRRAGFVVKAAVALSVVTLFFLMVTSFRAGRAINSLQAAEDPLRIKITGNQWWWNIEYRDQIPSNNIRTANELHLPVGRVVGLELTSTDVIHSFWLPNIHGKKDLIPNYPTTFYFRPDKVGTYSGQCAEFCGYQHAKMRFNVIVETPEEFNAWVAAQRQTPPPPTEKTAQRGQQVFLTSTCIQCHAILGTPANGSVGPDLTHIASRPYLAAGSLVNNDENLRSWITDPQKIKPGNRMPMHTLSDEDLKALVTYLRSLK